jgi:hypothetical protein
MLESRSVSVEDKINQILVKHNFELCVDCQLFYSWKQLHKTVGIFSTLLPISNKYTYIILTFGMQYYIVFYDLLLI